MINIQIEMLCLSISVLLVGILLLSFVIYPLVLFVIYKITWKRHAKIEEPIELPSVSLVIAAYNEENIIENKILNSLEINYPKEKLDIIIFSDSSTDNTEAIIKRYSNDGIILKVVNGRNGKTYCQNEVMKTIQSNIVVFSDANAMYSSGAIKELVIALQNSKVGTVIGKRVYTSHDDSLNKESLYEKMENAIKKHEAVIGGTIGACGSIYAIRRDDYIPLNPNYISDIIEPLLIHIKAHKKIVYAVNAVATENEENTIEEELMRKRRIVLRTLNSLWRIKFQLFKSPFLLTKLVFHKIIRWFTFEILIIVFLTGINANNIIGLGFALGVSVYLILGSILYAISKINCNTKFNKIFSIILYSYVMFYSSFLAFIDFVRGKNKVVWDARH